MSQNLIIALLLCTLSLSTLAQICPPPEEFLPCECDESYSTLNLTLIYCASNNDENWDIKELFDRVAPMVDSDIVYDRFYMVGNNIREIPANAFQYMKFKSIEIQTNNNLRYISPDAFNATLTVTKNLYLSGNQNLFYPPYNSDEIFKLVNKFTNVESVHIQQMHGIRTIPDNAFGYLPNLTYLRLGSCYLEGIGSKVFANLPKLNEVILAYCDISINEFANDTFEGISSDAEVNLEHNSFSRLPEHVFKPLLDNARSVKVGGQDCAWWCTDVRLDCDEESEWLCKNVTAYRPVLKGFLCKFDSGYGDIWNYCDDHSA